MFQRKAVVFQAKEVKTKLMNLDTGANRLITWNDHLFTMINKNVKSQLCTADSKNFCVGTVGIFQTSNSAQM